MLLSFTLALTLVSSFQEQEATWPETGLPVQDPVCEAILDAATEENQVMDHLKELVDGIGPRLSSSSNLTEATHWAADRFSEFGIPEVRIEEWGTFPVGFDRLRMTGRVVQPRKVPLEITTSSWTAGTDGTQRARVVLAPTSTEELEAAKGDFAGAWVLVNSSRTPRFDSDRDDFRSLLGRVLDAEDILGILTVSRNELVRTGGRSQIDYDNLPHRVSIKLTRSQGRELVRWLEQGVEVEAEFDLAHRFVEGPIPLYNVIAEIPGTDKADELIIMGGHLDSWDGATGTNDNGTGTATTMEAARLLAIALAETGQKPRRTIRFMLWSGEEQGLLGSKAYIKQHPEELDRVSACLVHDGGTNFLSGITATPSLMPLFLEALEPIDRMVAEYEDDEITFKIKAVDSLPFGVGSDHDSYLQAGMPGFFWEQSGTSNYSYVHHTQNDTYENAIAKYEEHSAKVIALAAWRLANMEQMIPRDDLRQGGQSRRGGDRRMLGVYLDEESGHTVTGLIQDGMAQTSGMKVGDIILAIDDAKIESQGDFRRAMRGGEAQKIITVKRGDQKLKFQFDWEKKTSGPFMG
ncbi:MAG: M20/M25/M40 family metallo-hydrolase [Planctomycetes bacterium]|nr:M20/M25/M40 family metallo-hydrolase [Planctomycetota bacterium]